MHRVLDQAPRGKANYIQLRREWSICIHATDAQPDAPGRPNGDGGPYPDRLLVRSDANARDRLQQIGELDDRIVSGT